MRAALNSSPIIGALGAIALASMGLVAYLPGMGLLGSVRATYIPMAPSTAVNFLLLGLVLLTVNGRRLSGTRAVIPLAVTLLVSIFGILEVVGYFSGIDLNFEDALVPAAGQLNGAPIARMSPATGAAFSLSGVAVFLLTLRRTLPKRNKLIQRLGSALGIIVLLISFVFCLAYLYGTPLLYGMGATVPMALTTALAFLLLSISLLTSERDVFPLSLFTGTSTRAYLLRFILPVSTLSVILGGATLVYTQQTSEVNPAFTSAALTVLIAAVTAFLATLISRHMGSEIDDSKTAARRANEELRASEHSLKEAQRLANMGSWTWNLKTNDLVWTDNLCRIHGMKPEEFDGRLETALPLIHPDDVKTVVEKGQQLLRERQPLSFEARIVLGNGGVKTIQSSQQLILDDQGNIAQMLGIVQDITERRETETKREALERQLRHAQKMEAIGLLAGGIAHDFNNILGAILGNAELALAAVATEGRLHDNLRRIIEGGSRAKGLVRKILSFSRQDECEPEPLDFAEVVSEVLDLVRATVPAMIDIHDNTDSSCGLVRADRTHLHQVAMNLCINASHAMSKTGGVLEVSLHRVDVDAALASTNEHLREGSYVKLTVADTGCGMDEATQARIFDPFFTTKPVDEGTGMGLSVVHGNVMGAGGTIIVRSVVGEGTTFEVYLPTCDEARPCNTSQSTAHPVTGSGSILLVDDETALVETATEMLENLGYQVTALDSGIEAIEIFREQPDRFDLVITDQAMPYVSGVELAEALKSIRADIPVIVATGYSDIVSPEKARQLGFCGYLAKPYNSAALSGAVAEALRGKDVLAKRHELSLART